MPVLRSAKIGETARNMLVSPFSAITTRSTTLASPSAAEIFDRSPSR